MACGDSLSALYHPLTRGTNPQARNNSCLRGAIFPSPLKHICCHHLRCGCSCSRCILSVLFFLSAVCLCGTKWHRQPCGHLLPSFQVRESDWQVLLFKEVEHRSSLFVLLVTPNWRPCAVTAELIFVSAHRVSLALTMANFLSSSFNSPLACRGGKLFFVETPFFS